MGLEKSDSKTYASIIGDRPHIRVKTESTNPNAVKREYETSDGTKGEKHELAYDNITGKIESIELVEGKFGMQIQVLLDGVILSIGTATNFGSDLMKKLPAVDLTKEVNIAPYSFEDDKKKIQKGVTVYQDEEKISNFFWDGKKNLHGFPELPKDYKTFTSDKWKSHFLDVKMFLQDYIQENVINKMEVPDEVETSVDDIPLG